MQYINNSKAYVWQLASASYAQAISSRYETILRDGILMEGNVPIDKGGADNSYTFSNRNPGNIAVVRKYNPTGVLQYAIAGAIMPYSNAKGAVPDEDDFKIEDFDGTINFDLQFKIRRQGSVYFFDNYDTGNPIFYQYDAWHETGHPDRWSKDFHFEAEVYDNAANEPTRVTEDPAGAPHTAITNGDFRDYTTFISFTNSSDIAEYDFTPRQTSATDYYLWVKARNTGSQGTLNIEVDDATATTIYTPTICVTSTDWKWYRFATGTLTPIIFNLTDQKYTLRLLCSTQDVEVDQIVVAYDKNLSLSPEPDRCTSLTTNYCIDNADIAEVATGNDTPSSTYWVTINQNIIHLNGDFTVNSTPYSFSGKTIIIEPGAKIIVASGKKLIIDSHSILMGCNDLWKGIELEDGTAELEIDNTVIEDAEKAIEILGEPSAISDLKLTNSTFDHNDISLFEASTNTTATDFQNGNTVITGCTFRCKDRNVYGLSRKSSSHISIARCDNLDIGNTGDVQNIFEDAAEGIRLNNPEAFTISNNLIHNMINYTTFRSGFGIVLSINTIGNTPNAVTRLISENEINDNEIGILSAGIPTKVDNNIITGNRQGIQFKYCFNNNDATDHIIVSNNNISQSQRNIVLNSCGGNNIIEINDNPLLQVSYPPDVSQYSAAIDINGILGSSNEITIENNVIHSTGTYGIQIKNENGNGTKHIFGNTINMLHDHAALSKMYGIKLANCFTPGLCENTIAGVKIKDENVLNGKEAIELDNCPNTTVQCSDVSYTEQGIVFVQDCSPVTYQSNAVNEHKYGLTTGNTSTFGLIGPQDVNANGDSRGNLFQGWKDTNGDPTGLYQTQPTSLYIDGYATFRFNQPLNEDFFTEANDVPNHLYYTPLTNGDNAGNPFNPASSSAPTMFTCTTGNCALVPFTDGGSITKEYFESIIETEIPESELMRNVIIYNKLNLYRFLNDSLNWLDSSTVISDFFDSVSTANVGWTMETRRMAEALSDNAVLSDPGLLESAIDAARSVNDLLDDGDGTYSINQKALNTAYLNWLESGVDTLSSEDSTTISDIANQCPYSGGMAVYEARALYEMAVESKYYDDDALCGEEELAKYFNPIKINDTKQNVIHAGVFPNPTSGKLNISLSQLVEKGTIQLYDLSGRLIVKNALSDKSRMTQINIESVSPGTYFYKISNSENEIDHGKIVLIK